MFSGNKHMLADHLATYGGEGLFVGGTMP